MAELDKKPYEISLWDDVLTWVVTDQDGNVTTSTEAPSEVPEGSTVSQFFDEVKLCVIGANDMASWAKADNPVFTENVNGQKTLTFSMVMQYYDESVGENVKNPFLNLLVNERKVKLYYDNEWYDLIIKNIQESPYSDKFNYTAQSAPINELSKTGFNLEFDTELENNMGTILDLSQKVVEGTDWQIDTENSDILRQYIEEPVYEYTYSGQATNLLTQEEITLTDTKIYIFYSQLQQQSDDSYLNPVLAALPAMVSGAPYLDDNRVLLNQDGEYATNISIPRAGDSFPTLALTDYRGMRLNRNQTTVYDSKIDKYVTVYTNADEDLVYCYKETQYISPVIVQNFVVNNESFTNIDGWGCNNTDTLSLEFEREPATNSFLHFEPASVNNYLFNNGVYYMRSQIHDFTKGESFTMRLKASIGVTGGMQVYIAPYVLQEGVYTVDTAHPLFSFDEWEVDGGYIKAKAPCQVSYSYDELLRSMIGIFIRANSTDWKLYEAQFYRTITVDGEDLIPGDAPTQEIINIVPHYYDPNQEGGYTSLDDLKYLDSNGTYTPLYDDNYEKIRSITIKESNRYNIIQTLCETFECWARFDVAHDPNTGKILLNENFTPIKKISFHQYVGDDNYAGFRYGVNLTNIQRNLVSDQLVTKIIVKANSNEFAQNGFCTIARASENYPKETFILDFIHYIRQGLLSNTEITNDLYLDANGYLGYYKKLAQINKNRETLITKLSEALKVADKLQADYQVADLAQESANVLYNTAYREYRQYKGVDYPGYDSAAEDPMIQQIQTTIEVQDQAAQMWAAKAATLSDQIEANDATIESIRDDLQTITNTKEELNAQFYKKYSRFIQEGSWISEDYVDDNLYFIDAQNTLRTSAEPQVSYTINVMEISALDDYKSYNFKIGDKTYVEDEEYFGYALNKPVKTPYQEEVIVSAVQRNLDNPISSTITVQNYKTRFQDLFQRITAQTQSLQYSSGAYNKAAGVVTTEGTIKSEVLGQSLINSNLILSNARDQSVVTDESGITITNLTNYRELVRLVSGGIFLSADGGQSWNNAITGNGINANYINAGQIDTALIRVGNGNFPSFRWDANGLAAYAFDKDPDTGLPQNFQFNKVVRFDQYGLYGFINSEATDFIPESLNDVLTNAQFAITWDGFQIKSNDGGGYIRISSADDIQVFDNNSERIKIGRVSENGAIDPIYGIRINNNGGAPVMVTGSDGNLWLQNVLTVGNGTTSSVAIGYNTSSAAADTHEGYHEVINANDNFVVYEDGHLKATSANITGEIHATSGSFSGTINVNDNFVVDSSGNITANSGTIGGMSISSLISSLGAVKIQPDRSTVFSKIRGKDDSYNQTTITLDSVITGMATTGSYLWRRKVGSSYQTLGTASSLTLTSNQIKTYLNDNKLTETIELVYTLNGETYTDTVVLSLILLSDEVDVQLYQVYFSDSQINKLYSNADDGAMPDMRPRTLRIGLELAHELLVNTDYTFALSVIMNNEEWNIFNDASNPSLPSFSEDEVVLEYDSENKLWNLNLNVIIDHPNVDATQYPTYNILRTALLNEASTLRFNFYTNQENTLQWVATSDIITLPPIYDSLMRFAVTAQSINAAINNKAMSFSDNGLVITNAGLKIQKSINDTYEDLLYYDTDNQQLVVKGNIQADSGTFHGRIEATDGYIQSLTINNGTDTITLGTVDVDGEEFIGIRAGDAFSIDTAGNVIAQSIKLGQGAEIEDYIQLGNAYIRNPAQYNDIVFEIQNNGASTFTIKDDGTGTIGNLTFDGNTGTLTGADGGISTWSINPTDARFYNIYAQGKISTAIFESNTVRVSGGSMIFKNGAIIKSINGRVLTVDDTIGLSLNDKIWVIKDGSSFESVVFATITNIVPADKTITIDVDPPADADTIINLGTLTNGNLSDWIIGVNSTSGDYANVGLHRNAISFNSAALDNGNLSLTKEIVLGDLTGVQLGTKTLSGSGLFAQNAFLTGTLTTQYKNVSGEDDNIQYAGVNTFGTGNGVSFNQPLTGLQNDSSNIIFWAGASGIDETSIQNSPFQVTANGTLYARQGYFEGSILTKATIEASEIITPIITGRAEGDNWLLTLRTPNATSSSVDKQGFIFLDGANRIVSFTSSTAYFNNNLLLDSNKQISFNNNSITNINNSAITSGDLNIVDTAMNKRIHLQGNQLSYETKEGDTWGVNSFISYNDSEKGLITSIANDVTIITNTYFKNLQDTYLNKSVYFGTDNMFYQVSKNNQETGGVGYNLYVNAIVE